MSRFLRLSSVFKSTTRKSVIFLVSAEMAPDAILVLHFCRAKQQNGVKTDVGSEAGDVKTQGLRHQ